MLERNWIKSISPSLSLGSCFSARKKSPTYFLSRIELGHNLPNANVVSGKITVSFPMKTHEKNVSFPNKISVKHSEWPWYTWPRIYGWICDACMYTLMLLSLLYSLLTFFQRENLLGNPLKKWAFSIYTALQIEPNVVSM